MPCSSSSSVRWFRPGWERVLLTSLCLLSSAFSVLVAHRQMELETEVAELRAEMRTADLAAAASEGVTIVRQRRLRREAAAAAGGDQGGASMPSHVIFFSQFSIYFLPKQNTCDLSNSTLSSENDSDSMKSHRRVRTATARACRARRGRRATTATPASPAPSAWRGPAVRGGPGDPRARPAEELCRNGTSRIPAGGRGGDPR